MIDKRVTALRLARGWSRPQLAQRAGMTRDQVAKIERGDIKNPRLDTLCKFKTVFETTLDDLVTCPDATPDAA